MRDFLLPPFRYFFYIYYTIFLNKNQPEVQDTSGLKLFTYSEPLYHELSGQ